MPKKGGQQHPQSLEKARKRKTSVPSSCVENDAIENAVCEQCKKEGDDSMLLLCDGKDGTCNAAFHSYCLGLSRVPKGSWFCPICINEDNVICQQCKQVGDVSVLLLCDGLEGTCNAACHTYCVGLKKVPKGPWFCAHCIERDSQGIGLSVNAQRVTGRSLKRAESPRASFGGYGSSTSSLKRRKRSQAMKENPTLKPDVQFCEVCNEIGDEGAMLLCDGKQGRCNLAYHTYCIDLHSVPTGEWFCPDCEKQMSLVGRKSRAISKKAISE